jgi:general secretion pathway protein G
MALMLALATVAATTIMVQLRNVQAAKQAILREDCHAIHSAAMAFRQDKGKAPGSAQELLAAGYLKALPRDIPVGGCSW